MPEETRGPGQGSRDTVKLLCPQETTTARPKNRTQKGIPSVLVIKSWSSFRLKGTKGDQAPSAGLVSAGWDAGWPHTLEATHCPHQASPESQEIPQGRHTLSGSHGRGRGRLHADLSKDETSASQSCGLWNDRHPVTCRPIGRFSGATLCVEALGLSEVEATHSPLWRCPL